MAIPPQLISFAFGASVQSTGRKHLRPGELREVHNVRSIVENEIRKRPGFDRFSPTADSGSFGTGAESLVSDGLRMISRDGDGKCWAENTTANTRTGRGTITRALPKYVTSKLTPSASGSVLVFDGTNYWSFTIGSGAYRWEIWDEDGNIVRTQTTQTAASITVLTAASDGTYVWVLWGTSTAGGVITSHRYTIASPGTAPTAATYYTLTASHDVSGIDARDIGSEIAVAILTVHTANGTGVHHASYLDAATGQPKGSPAAVSTAVGLTGGGQIQQSGLSILEGTVGSSWYSSFWQRRDTVFASGTSGTASNLTLVSNDVATLAASGVVLATASDTNPVLGWTSGFVRANGDRVVYSATDSYTGTPTQPRPYVLTRYTYTGSTATATIRRYSYPVSKPVEHGGTFYLLTGFDDGSDLNALKSYYLIDEDGNIITQIGYGVASAAGLTANPAVSLAEVRGRVTPLLVSGDKLFAGLLVNVGGGGGGSENDFACSFTCIDLAATYAAPVRLRDGLVAYPNGVPLRCGTSDNQREIVPMLSPVNATFTAGGGIALAGPTTVQYLYRLVDADGTIYRSAPSPAQTQTFNTTGRAVIVKPLTHLLPGTTCQIEVYLSEVNQVQPYLHVVVDNDTSVNTISVTVTPDDVDTNADTIYTFGGVLPSLPAPPSPAVWSFAGRTFLASGRFVWCSFELEEGIGERFNSALKFEWLDGEGDVIAGAPIDADSCAIFKRDTIGVIQGTGPDSRGAGNYVPLTCRAKKGLINVRSIATGPNGCYFQARADGRIYCVTPAREVVDVSQGMEDYRDEEITAAVWDEKNRHMLFFTDERVLVLDYAHPTDTQPNGRWYSWDSTGLLQGYGATVDPDGEVWHIETDGTLRSPGSTWQDATSGTAAEVYIDLTTGDLAAAGQLQGAYRLNRLALHGRTLGTARLMITVSDGGAVSTNHPAVLMGQQPKWSVRVPEHNSVSSTSVRIRETAGSNTEALVLDSLSLEIQPLAMGERLTVAQKLRRTG